MLSYEIYSYNSIILVIIYMTINIYHLHQPLFMIISHYIIFIVHIQLQGHINRELVGLNVRMINDDEDHWDIMTDPPSNPQSKADSSDDRVKEIDVSGAQTCLYKMFDKHTPEKVKKGILSQALLASIRLHRSTIGSINSVSDMNPYIINVIDDM